MTHPPTPENINEALAAIKFAELPDNHPRRFARAAVTEFRSNAAKENLPIVNLCDTGAPLLRRDEVVRASMPNHAIIAKTVKDSWSLTILSQSLLRRFRWLKTILTQIKKPHLIRRI